MQMVVKNLHVTNVCPGPVRTPVAENALLSDGSTYNKKDPLIEGGMTVESTKVRIEVALYTVKIVRWSACYV